MKNIEITVKKNEEKVVPFLWINGDDDHISVRAKLTGEGASLKLVGLFLGTKNATVKFDTDVIHFAPKTKSLTTIRGVFKDRASFDNDGMVRIQKGAKGADGYFASKVLLFGDAKGRSVPSLEIDENDLKAGHASTIGRPNEEQLLYLRSRGIAEKDAINLIVSGFFQPVINLLFLSEQLKVQKKIKRYLGHSL